MFMGEGDFFLEASLLPLSLRHVVDAFVGQPAFK